MNLNFFKKQQPNLIFSNDVVNLANTRYGVFSYLKNDDTIGKSLALYGEWAENEISFLKEFIKPGMTVLDIGSNVGTHALSFSKMVTKAGEVIAFEPQRFTYQILASNAALNGATNIIPVMSGVSDENTTFENLDINYTESDKNFGAVHFRENKKSEFSYKTINIRKLDDFNFSKLDFIKIDAEGMEERVLNGGKQTIESFRPVIYLEAAAWKWVSNIESIFSPFNYSLFLHSVKAFNPNNFYGEQKNIFGDAGEKNILAIPKERVELIRAYEAKLPLFSRESYNS